MSGATIEQLRRRRPRSRFVRASLIVFAALVIASWAQVVSRDAAFFSSRRIDNVVRFLGKAVPAPLRDADFDLGVLWSWVVEYFGRRGGSALATTLAISVAAAVLAGAIGLLLAFLSARTFATPEPYDAAPGRAAPIRRILWTGLRGFLRSIMVLGRALPAYLLAFILLVILGPSPWAAVAALALHNVGILGRLGAETIENLPPRVPETLRSLGAGRLQIAVTAIMPAAMPRYLLYFFYRWETCVREATVLGLLGIVSLGYWIDDARARQRLDEMLLLVALGAALVILGDLISALARAIVRRAS